MADWQTQGHPHLESTIAQFKEALPGWWYSIGECQVSCDASCGPTSESEHIAFIPKDRRFDDGFHVDLQQPSSLGQALLTVMTEARQAINDCIGDGM